MRTITGVFLDPGRDAGPSWPLGTLWNTKGARERWKGEDVEEEEREGEKRDGI